ncbi:major facilitator superfamily domain-containing protein [Zychaea mexicana]|uniref:major facilitator superfamily domain-containing protein n=1 Tax=Zychaea mexicana TaxID=64656 RepID=UPI0022FF1FDA|nr:major facilitator superfamily domain-containing protein [Zychaea mexicana]KAI9493817.1 major facilitator superfamily domain-containing protein [Zychaea mexicana]
MKDYSHYYPKVDPDIERALLKKLDMRLVAWGALAYFSNVLLRGNMPYAFTTGMNTDLHLNSSAYNWAVSMFFISYSVFQMPSNIIFSQVKPKYYLPTAVILSGVLSNMAVFITDKHRGLLYVIRFCMGLSEAGCYPCIIFLISSWYTQKELNTRACMIVIGSNLACAANGLIGGTVLQTLDGVANIRGWKWMFIIEGTVAIVIGIAGYFTLPNYPHNTPWITGAEREVAMQRKPISQNLWKEHESLLFVSAKTLKHLATTPYIYMLTFMFACIVMGDTVMHNFAIILNGMGYSSVQSNYWSASVYIFSSVPTLVLARTSDTMRHKGLHIFLVSLWSALWYCMSWFGSVQIMFAAAFAVTLNAVLIPITLNWSSQIYACDHEMRAVMMALIVSVGNLVPYLINPITWEVTDAPEFHTGKITCAMAGLGAAVACVLIALCLKLRIRLPQDVRQEERQSERQPLLIHIPRCYDDDDDDHLGYRALASPP